MSEYNIQMNKYNALNAGYDQLYPATKIENVDGLNTALQNNDPRQWGLGADSILVDSLDNALETGWYKSNGATPASGYWNCLTERYNSQSVTQTAVEYDGYGATIARRMLSLGVFDPWEWVNPPLTIDKEYRTTERYRGKPVYAKAVSVGDIAANALVIANTFTNGAEAVVRCYAVAKYANSMMTTPQNGQFSGVHFTADGLVYGPNNQVRVYIQSPDTNFTDGVAVAYYTKA